MLSESTLYAALPDALASVDLPFLGARTQGKVRDLYPVSYTHLDVYKRQVNEVPTLLMIAIVILVVVKPF